VIPFEAVIQLDTQSVTRWTRCVYSTRSARGNLWEGKNQKRTIRALHGSMSCPKSRGGVGLVRNCWI